MNASPGHQTIVVGVDGSAASAAAVRWAAAEASRRHARLHAVHVVEHERSGCTNLRSDLRLEVERARQIVPGRVGDWVARAGLEVDIAVTVLTGDVASKLARETGDAMLVVVGTPDGPRHAALPAELATQCLCRVATVDESGDPSIEDVPAISTEGTSHARS